MNLSNILLFLGALAISAVQGENAFSAVQDEEAIFDSFGMTKIHRAILDNKTAKVEQLITANQDLIDLPDKSSKSTPLHLLVEKVSTRTGDAQVATIKLIQTLVDLKANRQLQTDSGWTALNKATYLASDLSDYPLEVIKILLKDCVGVNIKSRGQTALHFAASSRLENNRSKQLVDLFIENCKSYIDFDAANDSNGWTAMKIALAADNMDSVSVLKPRTSYFSLLMKIVLVIVGLALTAIAAIVGFYIYKSKQNGSSKIEPEDPISTSKVSDDDEGAGVAGIEDKSD